MERTMPVVNALVLEDSKCGFVLKQYNLLPKLGSAPATTSRTLLQAGSHFVDLTMMDIARLLMLL